MGHLDPEAEPLFLSPTHAARILTHVQAEWPLEACGLLGGVGRRVLQVYPVRNELASPVRYRVHPEDLIRVVQELESRGWELVGIYHSHPHGPPVPSPTDVAEAYYPESVYLIAAPVQGEWRLRAFRIVNGQVREVPIRLVEDVSP
ncbi:M67 family metallopeptidase [Thermoflexus hugenholtzii]|jgi:Predicted metal-dependent protease of the PAD1/JAB1 superfamily|uniref:Proteasome lid subunit RPN8/RPN11, contains Jab1/MPN metalloenzyme (JAMM) motif n=1 Tax=Thermoflexus hugenholtzii JAD2 TaxID=877466 RepID=A0A212RTH7_9CHLR|nr:M67 family metallopeptidase [Thermoflexus hugenholtzii]SNB75832.1 Proteasome lid subunit RPN8/RPN11, contains Jab1/MPN metalloenzyme (JAMM) motif [Thermoflexus hugenholtzii JAD2]